MARYIHLLGSLVVVVSAIPLEDQAIPKFDPVPYEYAHDADGNPHRVDSMEINELEEIERFKPDVQNKYLLFTRDNPDVSQLIVFGNSSTVNSSSFSAQKRIVVLIHGWRNTATSPIFKVLVPAFLSAADVNVIVVDWSVGANIKNYITAIANTITSGKSVAKFLNWLNSETGASPSSYHIVGHSLGGHQCGIVSRNMDEKAAYVTALDPAMPFWLTNSERFKANDGVYTEVIHVNSGLLGMLAPQGQVDFYPNGGLGMQGCNDDSCDHARAYLFFGESVSSGGFTGVQCSSYTDALSESCDLDGRLQMGGITPKTGHKGVYYLKTNAAPPYSKG